MALKTGNSVLITFYLQTLMVKCKLLDVNFIAEGEQDLESLILKFNGLAGVNRDELRICSLYIHSAIAHFAVLTR